MERLTTNKDVSEMDMLELAFNCCYSKDGNARYRDFEIDMDARDFARNLMTTLTGEDMPLNNNDFDEEIFNNLQYDPFTDIKGLIALFYRNLFVMTELRGRLKAYEDLQEMVGIPFEELVRCLNHVIPDGAKNPKKAITLTDEDVDKWQQYKEAEEQGLLLRLPCKIGDILYPLIPSHINKYEVRGLYFDNFQDKWVCEVVYEEIAGKKNKAVCDFDIIGKTLFLTREEAELARENMKEV